MELKKFISENDIKNIYISHAIFHKVYPIIKKYNLEINNQSNDLNTIFWGFNTTKDIKNIRDFKGKIWIMWTDEDSDYKIKYRKKTLNFTKLLTVEKHLNYNENIKNNLLHENIISESIKLDEENDLCIKDYIDNLFQLEYFNKIKLNLYTDVKSNILDILLSLNEITLCNSLEYDIGILEKIDTSIITKFGLEGKLVFVNENCNFPNCVYYSNYLELIKKIYYYGLNLNNFRDTIKSSFISYIRYSVPDKTIVYIPIWKRHNLLEECINSIKNQSVDILGVCSLNEDIKFCKKNNIKSILVSNNPLGQKFQFGMEFCRLFFPKNVVIMGSDDIMPNQYIENINKYVDSYDIIGYKTWKIYEIINKQTLKLSYNHPITVKDGKEYWGNTGLAYKYNFNTPYYGFPKEILDESPYMIGAGRSIGYKLLNKLNWEVYQIFLDKYLDTNSIFRILVQKKASFKILNDYNFCITSLKENIDMITPLDEYKNHENVIIQ